MTSTANPLTIPPHGLTHEAAGGLVITCHQTPQAGYVIQARRNNRFVEELASRHDFETDALRRWDALRAQHPAATVVPMPVRTPLAEAA